MKQLIGRGLLSFCALTVSLIAQSALAQQDPAVVGQWSAVMTWPYKSVHACVLPNRKVMWWPSFANGDNPTMWDPVANTNTALAHAGVNIFCGGHVLLPGGQLFVVGGHISDWKGLQTAYKYNYSTNQWTRLLPDMNNGRWYPTCTILPNKDILVISGYKNPGDVNVESQVWQASLGTPSWRNLTNAHKALPFYPFMFVAPNGQVFYAGPERATQYLNVSGAGQWSATVINSNFGLRNWGSAVMYDSGKILLMGGTPTPPYRDTCGDPAKAELAGSIETHQGDHLAAFSAFRIGDVPIMTARNKDMRRERVVVGFHCRKLGLNITYRRRESLQCVLKACPTHDCSSEHIDS